MSELISQGTTLIRVDALLARSMQLASHPFSNDWRLVAAEDRGELDRQIKDAGWTLFYLAGEIKARAFGHGEKAVRRALARILEGPELETFNCMEITSWKTMRFLRMPFVTLTAHARQIQEGSTLLKPRWTSDRAQEHSTDQLRTEAFERRNNVVNQY